MTEAVRQYSEAEMRALLTRRVDLPAYNRIEPLKVFANIAFQWAVIIPTLVAAYWSGHWAVYAAAMLIIVSRQHALGIIMHDGTHFSPITPIDPARKGVGT